jgi:acetolactate synthase-1/2/3 large subunit
MMNSQELETASRLGLDLVVLVLQHNASTVESADGLVPALNAAFAGGGVHIVSAPVDYAGNSRVLIDELQAHAAERRGQP